jgi:sec-independent protein translocase protein TatB
LIVVGPKDLPVMLRKLGQFIGRLRGMANEFRASFDEMARQSELDELRKEVEAMREGQYTAHARDPRPTPRRQVDQVFADIDASLNSGDGEDSPFDAYEPPPRTVEAPPRASRSSPSPRKAPAPAKPKAAASKLEIVSPAKRAAPKGDLSVRRAKPSRPASRGEPRPRRPPRRRQFGHHLVTNAVGHDPKTRSRPRARRCWTT